MGQLVTCKQIIIIIEWKCMMNFENCISFLFLPDLWIRLIFHIAACGYDKCFQTECYLGSVAFCCVRTMEIYVFRSKMDCLSEWSQGFLINRVEFIDDDDDDVEWMQIENYYRIRTNFLKLRQFSILCITSIVYTIGF